MSGYEEEHNIPRTAAPSQTRPTHRLDFSSFFSALRQIDNDASTSTSTSATTPHRNNVHAVPYPAEVAALYRQLANGFQVLQGETEGVAFEDASAAATAGTGSGNPLLAELIGTLMRNAESPPREIHGMSNTFFDELERVPRKELKKDDSCPICSSPFLEDKYPLVVRLPCHKDHMFDLECIQPWLKLNTTCPLDRIDLEKKKVKTPAKATPAEESDGEYDDMYA